MFADILSILVQFASLAGVAALLAAVVNIVKWFGWIPNGNAGRVFAILNLIAMALLVYFHFFFPTVSLQFWDEQAALAARILLIVLGYVMQLKVGASTAGTLSDMKIPVIGASNTDKTLLKS